MSCVPEPPPLPSRYAVSAVTRPVSDTVKREPRFALLVRPAEGVAATVARPANLLWIGGSYAPPTASCAVPVLPAPNGDAAPSLNTSAFPYQLFPPGVVP